MRPVKRLIALVAVCLFTGAIGAEAWAERLALPAPPRRSEPWTPPETRLPRFLVDAAQMLFEQGLGDPRGCEYRRIRVRVGDIQGRPSEASTTGWVLPGDDDDDGDGPRFAVAWSGLVYPLVSVGEPADLDAQIRALAKWTGPEVGRPINPPRSDEAGSIALEPFHPIQICFLLRLGRADLAEALWTSAGRSLAPKPNGPGPGLDLRDHGVSYMSLATDFAWFRFNRAVRAHMEGDDALALADARALDAFWRAVDAKAEEMGFPHRPGPLPPGYKIASRYISFLDQAPALLADQERRARERANPPPPAPEGNEVARLIRDLDQIQGAMHGGVRYRWVQNMPAVQKLVALGDDAVEPLIQDLRSDDRLTRLCGLGLGRWTIARDRSIVRADQAAYAALSEILKVSAFANLALTDENEAPVDRNALADRLQAYWDKNKGLPQVERWYQTLADDEAGALAWLEAAGRVVEPEAPDFSDLDWFTGEPETPRESLCLRGEPLRDGRAPSVAELMARRIEPMLKTPEENARSPMRLPLRMADMLATWDPAAAAPTLRDLTRICRDRLVQSEEELDWTTRDIVQSIAKFTIIRAREGDRAALLEYADWIKTTSPVQLEISGRSLLKPLRLFLDDPDIADAAEWLFNDPQSRWVPLVGREGMGAESTRRASELFGSPMIEVPGFRKMVLAALADRSRLGTAEIDDEGRLSVRLDNGLSSTSGARGENRDDPDAPPIGAKTVVRTRDYYAARVGSPPNAPRFNLCWPEARRDAAVAEIVDYLKREAP